MHKKGSRKQIQSNIYNKQKRNKREYRKNNIERTAYKVIKVKPYKNKKEEFRENTQH